MNGPGCALDLELFTRKFSLSSFFFFSSLWLSQVTSLRLSSGHSGPSLSMQSMPPCPARPQISGGRVWATSLLGVAVRCVFCGIFFFPSRLCCPLRFQHSPQTCRWDGFLLFGNFSSFTTPSLGRVSVLNSFVSPFVFYIFSYLLSENRLPFWVPGVLCQHSEVVLWELFSIQTIFWWICGGEKVVSLYYSSTILGQPL